MELKKQDVGVWVNFPERQPVLGEQVVIAYNASKENGFYIKKELVDWTFKTMNNAQSNGTKFQWLRLPPLPVKKIKNADKKN